MPRYVNDFVSALVDYFQHKQKNVKKLRHFTHYVQFCWVFLVRKVEMLFISWCIYLAIALGTVVSPKRGWPNE